MGSCCSKTKEKPTNFRNHGSGQYLHEESLYEAQQQQRAEQVYQRQQTQQRSTISVGIRDSQTINPRIWSPTVRQTDAVQQRINHIQSITDRIIQPMVNQTISTQQKTNHAQPARIHPTVTQAVSTQQELSGKIQIASQVCTNQRFSSGTKSNLADPVQSCLAKLRASNAPRDEWTIVDYVCKGTSIKKYIAVDIIELFDADNTIPFIARYRRDKTGGMDADKLRHVRRSYDTAILIKERATTIIAEIRKMEKWTVEIESFIKGTRSLNDLEEIYSMFKVTESTLVKRAIDVGLETPALKIIMAQDPRLSTLVDPKTEGLRTINEVMDGVVCILADMIIKDQHTYDLIKKLRLKCDMIIKSKKLKSEESQTDVPKTNNKDQFYENDKYELYHEFSSTVKNIKPHQVLAVNRGEARKELSVEVKIPHEFDQSFKDHCFMRYTTAVNASNVHKKLLSAAFDYALEKSVKESVIKRSRQDMKERAEIASINVFAKNVKQLLMTPPVRGKVVTGVDPGFRHGCKLAVVSEQGDLLETETIYPHDEYNQNFRYNAERSLVRIVQKHKCTIFALGNGTACRETEVFLACLIKKEVFAPIDVVYTIVDETGASIYSCSNEASLEFPDIDINVVSAVSIARRLQDPMAELVKIDPKHLGVGMYQHDLPEQQLASKLNEVIMEVVSLVGVDVNTASVSLLKRIAGLDESKATRIINWRKSSGPFTNRIDLMKVSSIDSKTFEQCAGFIRIMPETAVSNDRQRASLNYLDQTWIHPESYDVAKWIMQSAGCDSRQLGTREFISAVKKFASRKCNNLADECGSTIGTIDIIVKGLSVEKGHDIRENGDSVVFRQSLTSLNDLAIGVVLTGVIRNITHFGAFVDIGMERNGLIHESLMREITVSVGQRVETEVIRIDKKRGRISLKLNNRLKN